MVLDVVRGYWSVAEGLTDITRRRVRDLAELMLVQSSDAADRSGEQVAAIADDILKQGQENKELLIGLIRTEIDRAVGRMGFVREEELAAVRNHVARLEAQNPGHVLGSGGGRKPGRAGRRQHPHGGGRSDRLQGGRPAPLAGGHRGHGAGTWHVAGSGCRRTPPAPRRQRSGTPQAGGSEEGHPRQEGRPHGQEGPRQEDRPRPRPPRQEGRPRRPQGRPRQEDRPRRPKAAATKKAPAAKKTPAARKPASTINAPDAAQPTDG